MNEQFLKLLGSAEDKYPHTLEKRFPHIIIRLIELWNTPQVEKYFEELMMNTRDGKRQGFPPDVAMEIFNLSLISDKQHKKSHTGQGTNVWGSIPGKKL